MALDSIGVTITTYAFIANLFLLLVNIKHYRDFRTRHFQDLIAMNVMFFMWIAGYFLMTLYAAPEYIEIAETGSDLASFGGFVGIAFLVAAFERVRQTPNTSVIVFAFFGAGVLATMGTASNYNITVWNGIYWDAQYASVMLGAMAIYFLIFSSRILPIPLKAWKRSLTVQRFKLGFQVPLLVIIVSCFLGLSMLILANLDLPMRVPFITVFGHRLDFMVYLGIFMIVTSYLSNKHPTMFFMANPDLLSLHLVVRESGVSIFSYNFETQTTEIGADLFSMACTGIRYVLAEALNTHGNVNVITTKDNEIVVREGEAIWGFLVVKKLNSLVHRLLEKTVMEFEKHYIDDVMGIIRPKKFIPFNQTIERYFEFALPRIQPLNL